MRVAWFGLALDSSSPKKARGRSVKLYYIVNTYQLDVIALDWDIKSPDSVFSYLGACELLTGFDWRHVSGEARGISGHQPLEIVSATRRSATVLENSFSEEFFAYAACLRPLPASTPRGVFCGGGKADLPILQQLESTFGPLLFLANHPDDLDGIANPGPQTLFTPRSPHFHGRAIGSASFVVSRRLLPCLAARGSGIPTVWIADGEEQKKLAAKWDLVILPPGFGLGEALVIEIKKQISHRATKRPAPPEFHREKKALEVTLARLVRASKVPVHKEKRTFATISSHDYVPFLEGYIANLLDLYSGAELCVYVLALDEKVRPRLMKRMNGQCEIRIVELADLWTTGQLPEILRRSIGVQAFSSKPLLIRRAMKETKGTVFYADSDVYFFSPPDTLWDEASANGILLFPHWNDTFECSRTDGLFNAGMVVASPKGVDFLDWWAERCWENANFGMNDGVVADQGYLDFGPALFDSVKSYRRGDHDVARWNLQSLGVHWNEKYPPEPRILNGEPVRTYHNAFVDSLGLFEIKCGWDALNHFFSPDFSGLQIPLPVFQLSLQQQAKHWLNLSRWLALGSKLSWDRSFNASWLRWAMGLSGRQLLSFLAGRRKVEWNPTPPLLPESRDPWIKANRRHFELLNSDTGQKLELKLKRPA